MGVLGISFSLLPYTDDEQKLTFQVSPCSTNQSNGSNLRLRFQRMNLITRLTTTSLEIQNLVHTIRHVRTVVCVSVQAKVVRCSCWVCSSSSYLEYSSKVYEAIATDYSPCKQIDCILIIYIDQLHHCSRLRNYSYSYRSIRTAIRAPRNISKQTRKKKK